MAAVACLATLFALPLAYPSLSAPLGGTAVGGGLAPEAWLAFAAGIVLGGILSGLGLRLGKRHNAPKV